MGKLRILQVCSANSFGGGEQHVSDLARALSERGHQVHLAVRATNNLRKALANCDISWHELPLSNAVDLLSVWHLARIIRREKIDILHAHVARDYIVCGLTAKLTAANFYLTRHHFNPLKSSLFYAWAINRAHRLIAVSSSVASSLTIAFPQFANRIIVIPNWIDINRVATFTRAEARVQLGISHRLVAAVIGQLTPLKRQELFIRAAARLIRGAGLREVEFLIIGAAELRDKDYERLLRGLVSELGIDDQVRFTGHIENLASYFAAFDLVVAPSENEAFSLVLAEAMAARTAVIATAVGGMKDIVGSEVNGLLVPPDDLNALTEGMRRLLYDAALRSRFGEAARSTVLERFDYTQMIGRIEALYLAHGDQLR